MTILSNDPSSVRIVHLRASPEVEICPHCGLLRLTPETAGYTGVFSCASAAQNKALRDISPANSEAPERRWMQEIVETALAGGLYTRC